MGSQNFGKTKPNKHIDIGSSLFFVTNVSAFFPVEFYDYRPVKINISNLDCKSGNITSLPFPDDSVESFKLVNFAFITDGGYFLPDASENDVKDQKYGCGCFWFKCSI